MHRTTNWNQFYFRVTLNWCAFRVRHPTCYSIERKMNNAAAENGIEQKLYSPCELITRLRCVVITRDVIWDLLFNAGALRRQWRSGRSVSPDFGLFRITQIRFGFCVFLLFRWWCARWTMRQSQRHRQPRKREISESDTKLFCVST